MKKAVFLLLIGLMTMNFTACIPIDEDVDPTDPVAKFLGTWKVSESCNRSNYSVYISVDPGNSAQVLLENFGNPGASYDAAVGLVVSNTIHVSSQTIGEGWTINGKGTYQSDGTIYWDYTLIIPPSQLDCTATFSK